MSGIEWLSITPEQLIRDIENIVIRQRENKYAFQIGLRDLDFNIDQDRLKDLGLTLPFPSIDLAEQALRGGAIIPTTFIEDDSTQHQVLSFDWRPIGNSGFNNCVTHSLALTDHGLFEVGRYAAASLNSQQRYWHWFLHKRLATSEEIHDWMAGKGLFSEQLFEQAYHALLGE